MGARVRFLFFRVDQPIEMLATPQHAAALAPGDAMKIHLSPEGLWPL